MSILWLTHTFSILRFKHKYEQTFCDLHTLLEYGKAGAVAKNLLIIDLCTADRVRAKHISKMKNDH